MFKKNLEKLKANLQNNNIDLAIITDDDSLYYFTGYYDFLHMSFGRPTILLVPKDSDTVLITPLIDAQLVSTNCPVDRIITWNDGVENEWNSLSETLDISCLINLQILSTSFFGVSKINSS